MLLNFKLNNFSRKLFSLGGISLLAGLAIWWTIHIFVISVISDARTPIDQPTLLAAAAYFPHSSQVQGRLAARLIEAGVADNETAEGNAELAEQAALRATALGQNNYENYLLLTAIKEQRGDLAGAVAAMNKALQLAPNYLDVHWRAANLFLRADQLNSAQKEFQAALALDISRAPAAFDLLWEATDGDWQALKQTAQGNATIQIAAAEYLLAKSRVTEATQIFAQVERTARAQAPQTPAFLVALIAANQVGAAHNFWQEITQPADAATINLIWNGSFEELQSKTLQQFAWNFTPSKFANFGASDEWAKSGRYALKIAFAGQDTTRLQGNIRQLIAVQAGHKYHFEGYALTTDLVSSEPVQIAIIRMTTGAVITTSNPVKNAGNNWQPLALEFTAPAPDTGVFIEIQRLPKFSFDEPTRGNVWFDDFTLRALN